MKKTFALLMALCLLLGVCASAEALKSVDEVMAGDPVEITLVTIWNSETPAHDMVYDYISERLLKECNATLKLHNLDTPETQYPLLFAADEDFDLVFSCDWYNYASYAQRDAFMELTPEMIETYMPLNFANMPAVAWDQAKVNGKIFLIPGNAVVFGARALVIRGDLREKYGLDPVTDMDTWFEYLQAVKENETDIYPLAGDILEFTNLLQQYYMPEAGSLVAQFLSTYIDKDPAQFIKLWEHDGFMDFLARCREAYVNGYWSSDAMTSTTIFAATFSDGKSACYAHNLTTAFGRKYNSNLNNPTWNCEFVDILSHVSKDVTTYIGSGTAVNAKCKNPERALMVLDLMMNDQQLHDTAYYGIEGVHWTLTEDGFVDRTLNSELPDDQKFGSGTETWSYYNSELNRPSAYTRDPEWAQVKAHFDANIRVNPTATFVFDASKVENEIAALTNVYDQYFKPLMYGMVEDIEAGVNELISMAEMAGIDAVLSEAQAQLDAYYASK